MSGVRWNPEYHTTSLNVYAITDRDISNIKSLASLTKVILFFATCFSMAPGFIAVAVDNAPPWTIMASCFPAMFLALLGGIYGDFVIAPLQTVIDESKPIADDQ